METRQSQQPNEALLREMTKHNSLEEFTDKCLFHTSAWGLTPGPNDNVFGVKAWCTNDPRITQSHIPMCETHTIVFPEDAGLYQNIRPNDYKPALMELSKARFREVEYQGPTQSNRSLSSWKVSRSRTHEDLLKELQKLGYTVNGRECEVKIADNEVISLHQDPERLHIFTGKEYLKLLEIVTFDYDRSTLEMMLDIEKQGYDGVKMRDSFTDKEISFFYESVGLFARAFEKLRRYEIKARHFSIDLGEDKFTPELVSSFQHAQKEKILKRKASLNKLQYKDNERSLR